MHVLQVAWQLTVAALCPYAPHPKAVVVAARAARIEVRNNQTAEQPGGKGQQKSFVVRAGLSAVDEVVRG
jgi:hypothetical protein